MGKGKTKFMPDNDKREMLFFVVSRNTNKAGNNISMQNKLDMLFQPSRMIRRPNHSMMEYFLLSRCNYKARLDGPKAYHLAWHP